ncbi:glycerol-3-phosphate dehydrogenase [NAD(P)+] [Nitrospira sp.]|nr:glycerol-3-phosphate dehydrogenase [NAD(P)+] [Nitrospira sp.]
MACMAQHEPMAKPLQNPIAVVGAGAWGTALAHHLSRNGRTVRLWAYETTVVSAIRSSRENSVFLPGVLLPASLEPTNSLGEALRDADAVVFAAPSHVARDVLVQMHRSRPEPCPLISATKGIEEGTHELMSDVIVDTFLQGRADLCTVLSGPSFALEVAQGQPTAVTLAGADAELVRRMQAVLMSSRFRVYGATDFIGVQLGGALKNVIALAAGAVDGLRLGHNTRAALITRGLAEMIRLGRAMGADPRTFYGLSGVGDLVLTCTGPASRNHRVGVRLGEGESLDQILSGMQTVAEGIRTARAAAGLAERYAVDMPIVREICAVLFEGKSCLRAVDALMEREPKEELAH